MQKGSTQSPEARKAIAKAVKLRWSKKSPAERAKQLANAHAARRKKK